MRFRWKTVGGLVLVAALGAWGALVFQRPSAPPQLPGASAADGSRSTSPTRGRIVPLLVADQAPLAFVPAQPASASEYRPSHGKVQLLPTIRASEAGAAAPPELSPAFPRPDELAPLAVNEAEDFAPIAPPELTAQQPAPQPLRHKIVDGDTLPALAERYLGSAARAAEIFEQNRERLSSPDLLPLGVELTIAQ